MVARVNTVSFQGMDIREIDVQVQMTNGLPAFTIVGLADKAVAESRERIRSALHGLGLALPPKRITVNLAPADVQKEGSHYDLAIALGILAIMGVIPAEEILDFTVLGELALDGSLSPVYGVLPAALHASACGRGIICPSLNGGEAAWAGDLKVLAPTDLLGLINHFKGTQVLTSPVPKTTEPAPISLRLEDIRGQETAKRALMIAAAGGHNMLMQGPPGSGKSMLAARLPGLLPSLEPKEALEVTMIHSLAGLLKEGRLLRDRPYRAPHHSASLAALAGGGIRAKPGEISLAHLGILFLDELPEFSRSALETLRQPLETGKITVSRANGAYTYLARAQLVAAMNPCKCGYLGDTQRSCTRAPLCGRDYQSRLSGPLLDRFDFHIDVPAVKPQDLSLPSPPSGETERFKDQILKARALQRRRFHTLRPDLGFSTNAEMTPELMDIVALPHREAQSLLVKAADHMRLTARGYHRVLKVARTLADLEGSEIITTAHIAEALSYRMPTFQTL